MAFKPPFITGDRIGQTRRHRDVNDAVSVHQPAPSARPENVVTRTLDARASETLLVRQTPSTSAV